MDNCVSIFTQRFNKKHSYATDMKMLGLYYREYQSAHGSLAQGVAAENVSTFIMRR